MTTQDRGGAEPSFREPRRGIGADLVIPVLAAAFTIYFMFETNHLTWEAKANGVVIGSLLLGLVALQVARTILRVMRTGHSLGFGEIAEWNKGQKQRLAVIAVLILFVALIGVLGTTLTLILVMGSLMWILGVRRWSTLAIGAFGVAASVYAAFILFLGTRLPEGPIEHLLASLGVGGS